MKKLKDGTEVPVDTPTRNTSKGRVLLTNKEIKAQKLVDDEWAAGAEMRQWKDDIAVTDVGMPRYVEDIIDVLTEEQRAALPEETLEKYSHKKTLRASKP